MSLPVWFSGSTDPIYAHAALGDSSFVLTQRDKNRVSAPKLPLWWIALHEATTEETLETIRGEDHTGDSVFPGRSIL
jgi:hypothetical protein